MSVGLDFNGSKRQMAVVQLQFEAAAVGRGELKYRRYAGSNRLMAVVTMQMQFVVTIAKDLDAQHLTLHRFDPIRPA